MQPEDTTAQTEEWRPVVGWEDLYSVSSLGRVRRDKPYDNTPKNGILHPSPVRGYLKLSLARNRTKTGAMVHRLVAIAFLGPCPLKCEVNHLDGCKMNNAVSNLEYTTSKGNRQHASRLGLLATGDRNGRRINPERTARGERQGLARLTAEQVREIRAAYVPKQMTQKMLATRYGVSKSTVCHLLSGRHWKHLLP